MALWHANALDLALHSALNLRHEGRWIGRVLWLTAFGGVAVMAPFAAVVALWLALRGYGRRALWLVATVAVGRLTVEGIKLLVARPRPPAVDRLELVTSFSFPSSHSAGTTMTCVALALLAGGGRPALAVALAGSALIGWTRIALGVHWPSDVLAGWGCGLLWTGLAARYLDPPRNGNGRTRAAWWRAPATGDPYQ